MAGHEHVRPGQPERPLHLEWIRPVAQVVGADFIRALRERHQGFHVWTVDDPSDAVLLLVDAVDGPMPQTRFVTQKAFEMGFKPIVVINKIDRDGARPDWVLDQTFELFDQLGASDEQLDFPVVYASALRGYASLDSETREGDMRPLFETIIEQVAPPPVNIDGPFQMRVSSLE